MEKKKEPGFLKRILHKLCPAKLVVPEEEIPIPKRRWFKKGECLDHLFQFVLEEKKEINPVLAGYFDQTLKSLIN